MTKYDALDAYLNVIMAALKKEVAHDLNACTKEEQKYVGSFVSKNIGMAFGKWKRKRTEKN